MRNNWAYRLVVLVLAGCPSLGAATPLDLASILGQAAGFTVLGLANGNVTINSAQSITGDVGYSNGVTSTTNQKVGVFNGTAFVHSGAQFSHTAATFAPSGGIQTGGQVDATLDQANQDALAASSFFTGLSAGDLAPGTVFDHQTLPALVDDDSRTFDSTIAGTNAEVTRIDLPSLSYKDDTLTFIGDASDVFVLNVAGSFDFAASQIILSGVGAGNVLINFANASAINIFKQETVFNGTILAPTGTVDYHNPATLNGAVIARNITLHSQFNISGPTSVPEPWTLPLVAAGLLMTASRRPSRRRRAAATR